MSQDVTESPSGNSSVRLTPAVKVSKGTKRTGPNQYRPSTLYNSKTMDTGIKGRVAIVAASSQGIGRATAEAFAAEGCRVAMCARNAPALQAAAERIEKQYRVEVFAQAL